MEKTNIKFKVVIFLLTLCLILPLLIVNITSSKTVNAGLVVSDFGETTTSEGIALDSAKWFFTDNLANLSKDKAYVDFSASSKKEDRFISRVQLQNLSKYGIQEYVSLSTVFQTIAESNMTEKPREKGTRWGVAFGLSYAGASYGQENSVFVGFEWQKSKTYDFVLVKFSKNGEEVLGRYEASSIIKGGKKTTMDINVNVDGDIVVLASGNGQTDVQIFDSKKFVPTNDAYFGYVQNNTAGCRLYKFEMNSLSYRNPENVNVYETFAQDSYNANVLYSQADYGFVKNGGLIVKNNELTFENVAGAFISTKYIYSNVEVAFDIPRMRREGGYEGDYYIPQTSSFGVTFGSQEYKAKNANYSFRVSFSKNNFDTFVNLDFSGKVLKQEKLPEKFNLWSESVVNGRVPQIRIFFTDGNLGVYAKYKGESAYKEILSYAFNKQEMTFIKDGYVRIYADGNTVDNREYSILSNMSIDNLAITNFDDKAQLITIAYRSNVWHKEDYVYIDSWDDSDLLK